MIRKFTTEINKVYLIQRHSMFWIKSGNGLLQIDFKAYDTLEDKIIYLAPGQYIRFLTGDFEIWIKEFFPETISHTEESRVLFKHLVSFGYIHNSEAMQQFFSPALQNSDNKLLYESVENWFQLNPFHAQRDEYKIIFNLRDKLDEQLADAKTFSGESCLINPAINKSGRLLRKRLGVSLNKMIQRRLLLEAQRELAFSDKPVKQIGGKLGFNDAAYFNRFFASRNGIPPLEFRRSFNYDRPDSFVQNLQELIRQYHKTEHSTSFYAGKMHMSIKTLIRKTNEKFSCTVGQLIRKKLFDSARILLQQHIPVNEIAGELGFQESNHFSAFFKSVSGQTPSAFRFKKCNK